MCTSERALENFIFMTPQARNKQLGLGGGGKGQRPPGGAIFCHGGGGGHSLKAWALTNYTNARANTVDEKYIFVGLSERSEREKNKLAPFLPK